MPVAPGRPRSPGSRCRRSRHRGLAPGAVPLLADRTVTVEVQPDDVEVAEVRDRLAASTGRYPQVWHTSRSSHRGRVGHCRTGRNRRRSRWSRSGDRIGGSRREMPIQRRAGQPDLGDDLGDGSAAAPQLCKRRKLLFSRTGTDTSGTGAYLLRRSRPRWAARRSALSISSYGYFPPAPGFGRTGRARA